MSDATIKFEVDDDIDLPPKVFQADISISSYGTNASWEDPGDPPEWEIVEIRNEKGEPVPEDELLLDLIYKAMEDFDWAEAERDYDNYVDEVEADVYRER